MFSNWTSMSHLNQERSTLIFEHRLCSPCDTWVTHYPGHMTSGWPSNDLMRPHDDPCNELMEIIMAKFRFQEEKRCWNRYHVCYVFVREWTCAWKCKKMFENMNLAKKRLENADKQVAIRYSNNSVGSNAINFALSGSTFLNWDIKLNCRLENFEFSVLKFLKILLMTLLVELFRDVSLWTS